MSRLTRGRLAKVAGVHSETIRYYERMGILKEPVRTPSGYRLYDLDTLNRVIFIKHAQSLGFRLREIAELLELQFCSDLSCEDILHRAHAKVAEIDTMMTSLERLRTSLLALAERCGTGCACQSACTALLDGAGIPHPASR